MMAGFLLGTAMMSTMEKNAQIGELVTLRQAQKVEVEQLKIKGQKIATAYNAFGYVVDRWRVDDEGIGAGNVYLLHPKSEERAHPQYLLGQADLAEYIRELTSAERALANTKSQLQSLGINE